MTNHIKSTKKKQGNKKKRLCGKDVEEKWDGVGDNICSSYRRTHMRVLIIRSKERQRMLHFSMCMNWYEYYCNNLIVEAKVGHRLNGLLRLTHTLAEKMGEVEGRKTLYYINVRWVGGKLHLMRWYRMDWYKVLCVVFMNRIIEEF